MIFGIYSYYVASLNETNKQLYNVYIIYDHSISDVPKHSSPEFHPPPCLDEDPWPSYLFMGSSVHGALIFYMRSLIKINGKLRDTN